MKRHLSAAVTAATFLTACAPGIEFGDAPISNDHISASKEVRVGAMPVALPAAVKAMVANSVELRGILSTKTSPQGRVETVEYGQGIRLSGDLVATAGHMVLDPKGQPIKALTKCGNLEVRTQTSAPNDTGLYGSSLRVGGYIAFRGPNNNALATPDFAALRVGNRPPAVRPHPVTYAGGTTKPGENLYTINYEPTSDGAQRSPDVSTLSTDAVRRGLSQPVILGMVALSRERNGLLQAVDSQRSYGVKSEKQVREGASGGPVYDNRGRLVGLIVQEVLAINRNELASRTGFTLFGPMPATVDEVLIQPVTTKMVADFSKGLPAQSDC